MVDPKKPTMYGQCQIFSNVPMDCPLCGQAITTNVGHYCEIRHGQTTVDGKKVQDAQRP